MGGGLVNRLWAYQKAKKLRTHPLSKYAILVNVVTNWNSAHHFLRGGRLEWVFRARYFRQINMLKLGKQPDSIIRRTHKNCFFTVWYIWFRENGCLNSTYYTGSQGNKKQKTKNTLYLKNSFEVNIFILNCKCQLGIVSSICFNSLFPVAYVVCT